MMKASKHPLPNSSRKPQITVFCASLGGGGAERAMVNLIQNFIEKGLAVDLLMVRADGVFLADVPPQVQVIDLKCRRTIFSVFKVARYLRQHRPEVLLSALDRVNLVAIWARWLSRTAVRVVISVHAPLSAVFGKPKSPWSFISMYFLLKHSYPKADRIVAVSEGVRKDMIEFIGISSQKLRTIYNPILHPILKKMGEETIPSGTLPIDDTPFILAVGRLSKEKDYGTLIRAFQKVKVQHPARLIILGEGEERGHLEALIQELDLGSHVFLPGFMTNPYSFMKQSSCFVLSSTFEGFGNVLVEALALGCPVISTLCPGGPREILQDGKWGRLVPIGDVDTMSAAILEVLEGKAESKNPDLDT
ncbi:MAG: glycosyltransferase, partial [Pseudobdellovibrionaceae bacterium]